MAIVTTNNQQPTELKSSYTGSLASTFDPFSIVRDEIIKPMLTPLVPSAPVIINVDGQNYTSDDITSLFFACSDDNVDPDAETTLKEILKQTLVYYDKSLSIQEVYSVQAGKKYNMILPSDKVIYTPTDVIDASKQFIAGQLTKDQFFANIAFYTRIQTFGYYFANDAAWDEFKTWFDKQIQPIVSMLSSDTISLCNDLQTIKLNGLTESFILRDDTSQNNDPYSFARLFVFYLMMYENILKQQASPAHMAGHLPFGFAENFCPSTVIIINVEKHAHAHPSQIKNEWDIIQAAMTMKPRIMNTNSIAKLTAITRMVSKMKNAGATKSNDITGRSAIIRFRKTPPTSVDLYKYIMRIYKHSSFIQSSENAVKSQKMTYNKPSRREPDNPDRQGKTGTVHYKPDLHIYLDCSGSISERDYQDAMKACIKLAKKLNINFYFNSFSDYMSNATKLPIQGKTVKEIYKIFRNVPKVAGGTDYEQIWHYINRSAKREKEVSIIISDYEYHAPNHYVKHPRFLYYAPISSTRWNWICDSAKSFAKTMMNICPDIRKHILM